MPECFSFALHRCVRREDLSEVPNPEQKLKKNLKLINICVIGTAEPQAIAISLQVRKALKSCTKSVE